MLDQTWGGSADARRAARPVLLCGALGIAAFAVTFCGALLLGRGLAGSALAALLLPLALSGAVAVGLAVTFVVAVLLEQPAGRRKATRTMAVATPLAALLALFAYASDPTGQSGVPLAGQEKPVVERPTARPPRIVRVPAGPGTPATPPRTEAGNPAPRTVAGPAVPRVVPGPVVRPAPAAADPGRAEVVPPLPPRLQRERSALRPWGIETADSPAGLAKAYGHAKGKARGRARGHTKRHPPRR